MISRELEQVFNLAVREAKRRRHDMVCMEHILWAMLQEPKATDLLQACGADLVKLEQDLASHLENLESVPEGQSFHIEQTVGLTRVLQRAAVHVQSSAKDQIEACDVLAAMYREPESHSVYLLSEQGISRLTLLDYISHGIVPGSEEERSPYELSDPEDQPSSKPSKDPLEAFTEHLNHKAKEGLLDPLIGRDEELTRTMRILCRRRKNNPIFVGESGVGKTAMAQGLALAIVEERVPEALANAQIYALDMGSLIAGTKFRGEFEQRLKAVVEAITQEPGRILFIDEIHTIIGAGAVSGGTLDASNILKPSLSNGELRCMGSTTYKEYTGIFEKDRALSRRFQKVDIDEPSVDETVKILRGLKSRYEAHHDVTYTISALRTAATLSHRFINERYLPDKAIDVIDEAGAQQRLVPPSQRKKTIRPKNVEEIVAKMAKIPPQTVSSTDRDKLKTLGRDLRWVIYGQDPAIENLVSAIKLSRSGLGNPTKPIGSFLFSGPTGVGKTELAKQLAKVMGVELLRFDMSEYMEKHTVSRLIGAPPGYVGFDQGGLLTEAVNKNPHAVIVLDEIEKAHPDIFNILLQVMDHASLTDNNGRKADFRNVVLIMTTNAGAFMMEQGSIGFNDSSRSNDGKEVIDKMFPPEFRNRLDAWISFSHLSPEVIEQVVDKLMAELQQQLDAKSITIELSDDARRWVARKGYDRKFGARPMARLIDQKIRRALAEEILFGKLADGGSVWIEVSPSDQEELAFRYEPRPHTRKSQRKPSQSVN
jgi:ATP-dependent Clp protease ATP-binding subunit ClpA